MDGSLLDNRSLRAVAPMLGLVLIFSGVTMLAPLGIALAEESRDRMALGISTSLALVLGLLLYVAYARRREDLRRRDAILVVVLSWLSISALGALPFILAG